MTVFHDTKKYLHKPGWVVMAHSHNTSSLTHPFKIFQLKPKWDLLSPIRQLLNNTKIDNPKFARFLCRLIPAQCPFERDINLFGRTLFHIPPMCKLNPFYEEFVMLRFRALSYLADECGEDVRRFC
jgi:hypothetical protein